MIVSPAVKDTDNYKVFAGRNSLILRKIYRIKKNLQRKFLKLVKNRRKKNGVWGKISMCGVCCTSLIS